jgi:hypothetical protein
MDGKISLEAKHQINQASRNITLMTVPPLTDPSDGTTLAVVMGRIDKNATCKLIQFAVKENEDM